MPHYRVYYARQIPDLKTPPTTRATLAQTHVLVHELDAQSLGQVYHRMQAESWPSTDEMLAFGEHVLALGSLHTTMCTGDVVEDLTTGTLYQTTFFDGWRELE